MNTTWITTTDRNGRRHYVTPAGSIVYGGGCGRTPWTVEYPVRGGQLPDYGMTDTMAEAKAWAALEEAHRGVAQ